MAYGQSVLTSEPGHMHLPLGAQLMGVPKSKGPQSPRGHRVPDLPGVLQSLHISEVKGCDDHCTHREKPRAGQQQVRQTRCDQEGLLSGSSLLPKRNPGRRLVPAELLE